MSPPLRPRRAADALAVAALAALVLIVWFTRVETVASRIEVAAGDLFAYWLPAYSLEAERLREPAVPLWNPYQAAGVPFLATLSSGPLYPARLLLLVLDVPAAMRWSILAHVLGGTLATWALCRRLGTGAAGAVAGGIVFGATFAFGNVYMPHFLEGGVWLPVGGLALVHVIGGGRLGWSVLLGVAAAMPILAGGHQISLYVLYGLAILGVALLAAAVRHGAVRFAALAGRLALAAAVAAGCAAPQLLPMLAWATETARQARPLTDLQIEPVPSLSLPWAAVKSTFLGGPWFLAPFYLSIPVVVLALVGFATRGLVGLLVGIATVGVYVLTLGPGTPAFFLYRLLPGMAMFRIPSRMTMLTDFLAAIGAAFGVCALGNRTFRWIAVVAVAVALLLPIRNSSQLPWTVPAADLAGPPGLFPLLARITDGGRAAVPGEVGLGSRKGTLLRIRVLQDQEPLSARRLERYLSAAADMAPPVDPPWPFQGALYVPRTIVRRPLFDLLAVRAFVLPEREPPPPIEPPLERVATIAGRTLYANPSALPRAYVVAHARFVPDEDAALATLVADDFDGRTEAVVVGAADPELAAAPRVPFRPARIALDGAERVEVDIDAERPSLLVLADAFAPGWRATVDGQPRALWQANYYVRGVAVRPGDRRVEFTYRAPGLGAGLAVAAAAWCAAGFGLALGRRRAVVGASG